MQLQTPVTPVSPSWTLGLDRPLLLLGSCFADEIGTRLSDAGFDVLCNPFGTLYNPLSVAAALQMALADTPFPEDKVFFHDGLWHSWMHHSRFSSPDRETCLARCNQSIQATREQLQKGPLLLVTFGTAWVFYRDGEVVANCHKLPPDQFVRRRLTVDEIVATWTALVSSLDARYATHHAQGSMLFTVSPIRHLADTAHGNQLSKSTLLLAVDQLVAQVSERSSHPQIDYFPSYEILLDELRDYRFYARDMCHPSDLAADIVYERFLETFVSPATRQQCLLNKKQALRAAHRPIITPDT